MSLTDADVRHVAMLARLGLTDAERERLRTELGAIIEHVSRLQQVDTSAIPETAQVGSIVNAWREDDDPAPSMPHADALRNAPQSDGTHFVVGAIQE